MRIPRIYTGQDITAGKLLQLEAGASQHIGRALRMQAGDSICLFNGSGHQWPAQITAIDKKQVSVLPDQSAIGTPESPLAIHLAIAISRGDRMDTVIQKSTELGVQAITPIISERTEVRLKGDREKKKLQHWQQVIVSACEQCGRNTLPELHPPSPVGQWLESSDSQLRFVLHHRGNKGLNADAQASSIDLLIGPEGGLSEAEIGSAQDRGFQPLTLGPRILSTETAPLAAVAILQAQWGDMNAGGTGD
ncbi:MAG: 16S rRNA (uracil(1498)-N(3))-methyltransferase [Halieaceae bacterium]